MHRYNGAMATDAELLAACKAAILDLLNGRVSEVEFGGRTWTYLDLDALRRYERDLIVRVGGGTAINRAWFGKL